MARAPSGSRRRSGGSRRAAVAGGGGGSSSGESVRKGTWMVEEDAVLLEHVRVHGPRDWSSIRSKGLLRRTGKSCRLRWVNKLRPNLKSGCKFSAEEERVVLDLQAKFGNKWARIATYLPGRTDNDVKNFWSTRQKRLARLMRPPRPGRPGKNLGAKKAAASSPASPSLARTIYPDQVPFEGSSTSGQCHAETPSVDAQNDPLVPYDQTGFQLMDSGGAFLPTFPAPDMEACSSNAAQLLPRTDNDVTNTWDDLSQEPSGRLLRTPLPRQPPTSSLQPPPSVGPFLDPVPFDSSSSGGQCHGGTAFMDAQKCELLPYDQTTTGSQFFGFEGAQPQVALATDSQASSSASLWPPQLPLYEPPYPLLDFSGMNSDIAPGFVSSTGATYDFDYHDDLLPAFMQSSQMTFPFSGTHDGVKIEPRAFSPNHFDDLPPDMFDSADPLPPASSPSRTISDP